MNKMTRCLSLIAGSLLLSAPSFAAVKDANEQGFHLEITQAIEAPAEIAFEHFTNDIGSWWLSSHTWFGDAKNLSIDTKAGGCFCEINGAQQNFSIPPARIVRPTPIAGKASTVHQGRTDDRAIFFD